MMSLEELFAPLYVSDELNIENATSDCWINTVEINDRKFPSLIGKKIAIIGILSEESNFENNIVRNYLYSMTKKEFGKIVVDLGNFIFDSRDEKIHEKLGYAISEVMAQGLIPILLGPTQEYTYSQYLAFDFLKKFSNLVIIDSRIDLYLNEKDDVWDKNYLYKIFMREPSFLFNMSHLGYQTYLTDTEAVKMMDKFNFEHVRLGKIRDGFDDIEPALRSGDFVSFDISAIRQGDAPGSTSPSPSGLTAEEACKLSRFAGLSDNLQSFGIYSYNLKQDNHDQTGHLIAQMIWYFVDGVVHRFNEVKIGDSINYRKYIATDSQTNTQVTFYKSNKTDRWWMEIPINDKNYNGKEVIPCSYKDYEQATNGEIPERFWKTLRRLK